MQAIRPEERMQHASTTREVFRSVLAIRETEDGYTFLLPDDALILRIVGEFISRERLCCPFFIFTLTVNPERSEVILSLSGPEGIKPFIRAEVGSYTDDEKWGSP